LLEHTPQYFRDLRGKVRGREFGYHNTRREIVRPNANNALPNASGLGKKLNDRRHRAAIEVVRLFLRKDNRFDLAQLCGFPMISVGFVFNRLAKRIFLYRF